MILGFAYEGRNNGLKSIIHRCYYNKDGMPRYKYVVPRAGPGVKRIGLQQR